MRSAGDEAAVSRNDRSAVPARVPAHAASLCARPAPLSRLVRLTPGHGNHGRVAAVSPARRLTDEPLASLKSRFGSARLSAVSKVLQRAEERQQLDKRSKQLLTAPVQVITSRVPKVKCQVLPLGSPFESSPSDARGCGPSQNAARRSCASGLFRKPRPASQQHSGPGHYYQPWPASQTKKSTLPFSVFLQSRPRSFLASSEGTGGRAASNCKVTHSFEPTPAARLCCLSAISRSKWSTTATPSRQ